MRRAGADLPDQAFIGGLAAAAYPGQRLAQGSPRDLQTKALFQHGGCLAERQGQLLV